MHKVPAIYSTWYHPKTDSTYTVIAISLDSTNDAQYPGEPYVVYVSHTYGEVRHRKLSEFSDGRFEIRDGSYADHTQHN